MADMEKFLDKADAEDRIFRKKLESKKGKIKDTNLFEEDEEDVSDLN
jgi:hypothetical protein